MTTESTATHKHEGVAGDPTETSSIPNADYTAQKPPELPGDDIKFYEPGDALPSDIQLDLQNNAMKEQDVMPNDYSADTHPEESEENNQASGANNGKISINRK